jgi:hypothetical protein
MITKLLTIFAPWPYAGNASAKSEAENWKARSKADATATILAVFLFASDKNPYCVFCFRGLFQGGLAPCRPCSVFPGLLTIPAPLLKRVAVSQTVLAKGA